MQILYKFGIVAIIMILSFQMQSQGLDHVPGEVIIQMQPNLVDNGKKLSLHSSISKSCTIEKSLFPGLGIYLLSFDPGKSLKSVMDELHQEDDILYVQENHKVSQRERPNDPFFLEQSYHETIDSELAWDITTGGTDSEGREIVIAVMDAGFDIQHEDFEGNVWVNSDEIPDDGIDNDNNGFVDDYFGWNFSELNDDHGSGQGTIHGTNVAGIAAARGDNGEGVTGVSWDAKLLFLSGLRTASEIVEAMSYTSDTRRLYNETNGEEGAFIVTSNISLGIRNGLAEDFPIWCNLYNTLGENGVLNVCAVDNLDSDVEVNGDIPTVCDSEYLITVTNTDPNNRKDPGAAFGRTSVDLGAPGAGNFTTSPNNNYNETSGTSVAAPLVAGTIALLYTSQCESIAERSLTEPGSTALTMKNLIFSGSKASSALIGITSQESVLNVFGSLQALEELCDPGVVANNIPDESIDIFPNVMDKENVNFIIEYNAKNTNGDPLVMMFDAKGTLIFQSELSETFFGVNQVSIDLSNNSSINNGFSNQLGAGVYFVSLILPDDNVITEKIVVY